MRTFTDGSGADSTAAVRSWLVQRRQLLCADLIQIKTYIQGEKWSQNRLLAISDRPLTWSHVGTFLPVNLKRNEVTSKVGLDTVTLKLQWSLKDTDLLLNFTPIDGAVPTVLQSFEKGIWDNGRVTLYRTFMPTLGDCNTFGACTMFAGRIAEITVDRLVADIKVNSLTEVFDQQLPPNLIEPSNVQAQYGIGAPPAGLSSLPTFTIATGSTPSLLLCDCTGPNAGQIFADNTFEFGYVQMATGGDCGLMMATVRRSTNLFGKNAFYLYEPLPWSPKVGDGLTGYVPFVRGTSASVTVRATIPNNPPYQIVIASWVSDAGVSLATGGTLTNVPSSPAAGQYSVSAGTYVFNSADAGKDVLISYSYAAASGLYQGFPNVPPASQAT